MRNCIFTVLMIATIFTSGCLFGKKAAPVKPMCKTALVKSLLPSAVQVEYTLQYDKGQAPRGGAWGNFGNLVKQERPLEAAGLLLSDRKVLTGDLMMHKRFIKSIAVRFGGKTVSARISDFAVNHRTVFIELSEPLKDAKPIKFQPNKKGPYLAVLRMLRGGQWITSVSSLSTAVVVPQKGEAYTGTSGGCLIVDKKGTPVGVGTGRLPLDDSWKGSPLKWETCSAEEMQKRLDELKARTDKAIFRVALNFRSPKKSASRGRYGGMGASSTEKNVTGLLIGEKTVMVLESLEPKLTARLERITIHPVKGDPVEAKFDCTLTDYGCFLVKLDKPLEGSVKFSTRDIMSLRNVILLSTDFELQGEKRVTYYVRRRINSYSLGWKRHVYPNIGGNSQRIFAFDSDGALVALPVSRREKVSMGRSYGNDPNATSVAYIKAVLNDLAVNTDSSNVPLIKKDENRLAWIGVVLQPLNKELARINNVSQLTRDGEIGALISYVYPNSPASKAGLKAGWVMLNLNVEGYPKPVDVRAEEYRIGANFPWDRWDGLPPQYWDGSISTPWQPAENILTRMLTDLGFEKKFSANFVADGKQIKKNFVVTVTPRHYNTAIRIKSKSLGLTVREMTFEVRRYFHKTATDPGVIVSAVEPGSKAGVGGIKPFEIITHVNDVPVKSVKDFENLIKDQEELRIAVLRMTKGRLVKFKMPTKAKKKIPTTPKAPTTQPASTTQQAPEQK